MQKDPKETPFSLEDKLEAIRAILDQMQRGVSDFDKQTALFKTGKQLIRECRAYLDVSELEIKKLVDGRLEDFSDEE